MKRTRKINRSRIMREIWIKREISRSQIAKNLGLDKSTISNNINDLLELGIIVETVEGNAGPQGGRKPIIIKMKKEYGCVLGLEITQDDYTAVAVDLDGEILYSKYEKVEVYGSNLQKKFIEIIENLKVEIESKGIKLIGVGLGLSGVVNSKEGVLKDSIPLGIEGELDLAGTLSQTLNVPVFIDNDANACVWGELAFHRRKELKDCLFLLLEYRDSDSKIPEEGRIGVGIGLVINGNVHYGHDYSAGEFRSVFRTEEYTGQFSLTPDEQARLNIDDNIKRRFLRELGANISLLVNTFNLTHIILGGEFEHFGNEVVEVLDDEIRKNWPYTYAYDRKKSIWFSSFGDKAVAYGAAGMVLNKIFSDLGILEEFEEHHEVQANAGII